MRRLAQERTIARHQGAAPNMFASGRGHHLRCGSAGPRGNGEDRRCPRYLAKVAVHINADYQMALRCINQEVPTRQGRSA